MKFYAIGFKSYVEIRQAEKAPQAHHSAVTRSCKVKIPVLTYPDDSPWGVFIDRVVDKKLKITCVYHEGGEVIKSMKTDKFRRKTKLSLRNGEMIELPKDVAAQFLTGKDDDE